MKYLALIALLVVAGCSHTYTGNAYTDYRMDSFSTVNHCLHTTQLRCM